MAVHTSHLGSVKLSGDEAAAFNRKLNHARGNKAATEAAKSGEKLSSAFVKSGVVRIDLKKYVTVKAKAK